MLSKPLKIYLALSCVAIIALKIAALTTQTVNTDEPQHLHVVWAWSQGLVQYRDVFDNHTPVFHLLFAPILDQVLAYTGDHASVLYAMRAFMAPIFFLNVLLTLRLLAKLKFEPRGMRYLLTLLAVTFPPFFCVSDEFRTDNLWVTAWLAVLLWLVRARSAFDYAMLGALCAMCSLVSLKTSGLLAGLGSAAIVVLLSKRKTLCRSDIFSGLSRALTFAIGAVYVLGTYAILFWWLEALPQMWYCVVLHNLVPSLGNWSHDLLKIIFPISLLVAYQWARVSRLGARDQIIVLHTLLYLTFQISFWPLITPQNTLPVVPLLPYVVFVLMPVEVRNGRFAVRFTAVAAAVSLFVTMLKIAPWENDAQRATSEIETMLNLTHRGEYVMDEKGEAILRPRPFYYALERITLERFKRGLIEDTIPESLVRTQTKVVRLARVFPRTRKFLEANYLPVLGYIQVAGQWLRGAAPKHVIIEIGAEYVVLVDGKITKETIDGRRTSGTLFLTAGQHVINGAGSKDVVLFLKRAYDLGLKPKRPETFKYEDIKQFPDARSHAESHAAITRADLRASS